MDINVRINEGCGPQPQLLWDAVWNPLTGCADWTLAQPGDPLNAGGLRAVQAIETAVILCLFTDRACPPNHPLAPPDGDMRGWWGDGVDVRTDLGEGPLGSLLWLLERSALDPAATPRWAVSFAIEALQPLIRQNVAARADAQAFLNPTPTRLDLAVQLYRSDGSKLFDRRYDNLWAQLDAASGAIAAPTSGVLDLGSGGIESLGLLG